MTKVADHCQSRVVLLDHDVPGAVNEGKAMWCRTICTRHVARSPIKSDVVRVTPQCVIIRPLSCMNIEGV